MNCVGRQTVTLLPTCKVLAQGASLDTYYLYILDSNRRIQAREDLTFESPESAIEAAQQRHDGRSMELWLRAQMIWSCDAVPPKR